MGKLRLGARGSGRRGASLIEITIALTVLAIVGVGASASLASSATANSRNREAALAQEAAQGVLDELRALPREEVFVRYNDDAADDPAAGASPGSGFAVASLRPVAGDADGLVGHVEFPGDGVDLHEDDVDRELGMPRDLDADALIGGVVDPTLVTILPVRVTVTYDGYGGPRTVAVVTQL